MLIVCNDKNKRFYKDLRDYGLSSRFVKKGPGISRARNFSAKASIRHYSKVLPYSGSRL